MMNRSDRIGMETSMVTKGDVAAVKKKKKNKKESPSSSLELPRTLELRKHGYVALARGLGSGTYELSPTGQSLASQSSTGAFEFVSDQFAAALFRQSSIDTEPKTLTLIAVRQAQDGALEIINTYDQAEAVHLFLKDAEDEYLSEEALAAILPIYA